MKWIISLILEPWTNRPLLSDGQTNLPSPLFQFQPPHSRSWMPCSSSLSPLALLRAPSRSRPPLTLLLALLLRVLLPQRPRRQGRPRDGLRVLVAKAFAGAEHVMVGGAGCAGAWLAACPWRRRCGGRAACGGGGRNARHTFDRESCGECFSWRA